MQRINTSGAGKPHSQHRQTTRSDGYENKHRKFGESRQNYVFTYREKSFDFEGSRLLAAKVSYRECTKCGERGAAERMVATFTIWEQSEMHLRFPARRSMSSSADPYLSTDAIIRPTTIIEATRLDSYLQRLGHPDVKIILASETFQQTGSFKFRAAYNVVINVPQKLFITASSGNFGQALAYACALTGKSCIVVMPSTSSQIKIAAVREYGGRVELIDTRVIARKKRVQELAEENPGAYIATPFDDPL